MQRPFEWAARLSRAERALMKKKLVSLFLTLLTILSLFPTAAFAAESTGVGITPVTDPNRWTTRLTASGQTYSYRPPTAAGRQLYCMDLGYSYRYGTESFLKSYTYRSATGTDADALWSEMVAKTGLGEMDAVTQENVKWMMSYIADYTGEIPGSLFMALQTYIWDNQSDKSAGGDPSGDIDAGGFANQDTYDQYVGYYNWLLGQKANEDAELQAKVSAEQGNTYAQFCLEHLNDHPMVLLAVFRVLYHLERTFQDTVVPSGGGHSLHIDRKRRRELSQRRMATGHKRGY